MPVPFLNPFLLNWLASRAFGRVEQEVVDELKRRVEKGDLGTYDGILFKDTIKGPNSAPSPGSPATENRADVGVVAASKREIVGIIDKIGTPKVTKGKNFTYYAGILKGVKIAIVETGTDFGAARKGVEALIQAYRPLRVVSLGFATPLSGGVKTMDLIVSDRIVGGSSGETFDLRAPALTAEPSPDAAGNSKGSAENKQNSGADAIFERFSSGALASFGAQALAEMSAAERRRVGEETGAVVAAVGALSVAKACAEAGVPFLSLRIAFDSREVGSSAARKIAASNQSAARAFGAFLGAVSKKPSAALDLYKVKERALEAADKLAAAFVAILASAPR